MGDYFTHKPHGGDEISPESVAYHTAPSSRTPSPLRSPETFGLQSPTLDTQNENVGKDLGVDNKVESDLEKIKQDLESLLNVSDTPKDAPKDVEVFRRDSRIRDLSLISSCPIQIPSPQRIVKQRPTISISDIYSPPSSSKDFIHPRPQTPYRPRNPRRSFSTSEISSPPSASPFGSPPLLTLHPATPQISPELQPLSTNTGQPPDLAVLRSALNIIQTQLTLLDNGIKANIASQLQKLPSSPTSTPLVVIDQDSLPDFTVPGDEIDRGVSRALLKTVKVCCVVERGLEAVIGVLENGDKNDKVDVGKKGEKGREEQVREWGTGVGRKKEEGDLMGACLERSKGVRREMRGALRGIEGVVGFDGTLGSEDG